MRLWVAKRGAISGGQPPIVCTLSEGNSSWTRFEEGLCCQFARCHGRVHCEELHWGRGFIMREVFEGSQFIGEVLLDRTIIWADQRRNQE
jgi:hypothetical protein